ncbi:NAD(P)/FAD-dependent oxidoreductase [Bifidobacterium scardovii]|uniref:FAD dependent oxidoreductase n=1 Tax=Bifidobacterium scardovii TaxID=158787 RepID=A0A087DBP4_9BIFI|nr:NAD(P)/FAD-dependent oxidoreductase [Bifidobacterium scardovii]KFI92944.1 FAD dependent oxidoreductase [Bifidobacterium scardovii]MBS6948273.1 NAD(P)/FAD-dependent oxidoreductase [Bifidobacterium scardovii]MDK6350382.1 NAD(P)/FAD-dependent oxidoreductase [Bifidobacterium scardovii]MDU2422950.1 NAD(P)/FAD-dependent oxidoreductase [Bifidobacterium scardovii]MDU3736975.1 NAD(P)/FAD-dependent oxidoreductase [Bifidobacterium scardovii]
MTQKQSVVIIGGGPAGLTAAWELVKNGGSEAYDVTVLEASREFGGISRTVRHNGNRMDIGGHRFFSKDERIMDWWKAVLPLQGAPSYDDKKLGRHHDLEPGGPDPEQTDEVMLKRHRVSRIFYGGRFFDYPISLKPATFKAMGFVMTMQAGFSYLKSMFHKLPEDNLENFYINRFGRKLYSMFFEGYTEKLWGRHPSQISADWGAQRVKGLSVLGVLANAFSKLLPKKRSSKEVETSLIEEFWYPKYGPGQLWETVEKRCEANGATVITDANVVEVRQANGAISSVVYEDSEGNRTEVAADQFISTMPIKDLVNAVDAAGADPQAADSKPAPKDMTVIANGLPYRDFVTVGLLVKRLRLKNTTTIPTLGNPPIVPDCWIYVQDPGYTVGRIQVFNNWSPYLVKDVDNTVWIGLEYFCSEGDAFWNMSEEECVKFAINEMVRMKIISSPADVLDTHREKVKKAYPAYFDTYAHMDELVEYLDSFGNLYCVGRNGQHHYNNMDHSMATAIEAVGNIKTGKTSKKNVWSVNTEKSYHEEK